VTVVTYVCVGAASVLMNGYGGYLECFMNRFGSFSSSSALSTLFVCTGSVRIQTNVAQTGNAVLMPCLHLVFSSFCLVNCVGIVRA
jgi:hypothetical protein